MLLWQFSTSHYCRKVRLALGYKKITYQVTNLTPGLHLLQVKPKTGLTTLPVLFPQILGQPEAIGDSTEILHYLETYTDTPSLLPDSSGARQQVWLLEDWLDESIGIASRFVYYHFRAHAGKALDPSLASQLVINLVRYQAGITEARVAQAEKRLSNALEILSPWQEKNYLVNQTLSVADITAAALLSPLGLIPHYRYSYPWVFEQIASIHEICGEKVPFT
jgi:glutathione S-transferase